MGFFKWGKKDDYDEFYDDDNYDPDESEDLDDDVRGKAEELEDAGITSGECFYCGEEDAMEYDGNWSFICSKCGKPMDKKSYYFWLAGGEIDDQTNW